MRSPKAVINSELLVWARDTAGLTLDEAARRLQKRVDQVQAWENGDDQPTLVQLRQIARVYKRSFSDFYLAQAPEENPPPHDFRRLPGEVALTYSPALRHQLRLAQTRRTIFHELCNDLGVPIPEFGLRASLTDDREALGPRIREFLGITLAEQQAWRDPRRAYKAWRTRIEAHGALTFQITGVPTTEIMGFSFAFPELPVIAVNQKARPNGRTFTLLHELVHLMLGYSGLCDIDEGMVRPAEEQEAEIFCNAVAGAALVSSADLLGFPLVRLRGAGRHEWGNDELEGIARAFSVSEEVILRRLLSLGRTTPAFYQRKRAEYLARYAQIDQQAREETEEQEIRRNMPRETLSNLGPLYTRLVLESFNQDNITLIDASRYLGLKARHISRLEDLALSE